jgi:hypothetical protein
LAASLAVNLAQATTIDVTRRGRTMKIRKRLAQLGLIMVALPLIGWGLEQLAKRADERKPGSGAGKWLRQGSDFAHGFGRGPLSSRLRASRR